MLYSVSLHLKYYIHIKYFKFNTMKTKTTIYMILFCVNAPLRTINKSY